MKLQLMALGLAAVLGACAEPAKIVRTEQAGSGYSFWTMNMKSSREGESSHRVYLKTSNEGGKLVVCGYLEANVNSLDQQAIEGWWRQADVSLNDTPIGKGSFLAVRKPGDRQATCIETTQPWRDAFRTPKLDAKGQVVFTYF